MPITRTRSKYYVLSVLGALVVAVGVLALPPSAQAQAVLPAIDKKCSPNPVQVGEQTTCIIDLEAPDSSSLFRVEFTDTFPIGVRPISAELTITIAPPSAQIITLPCTVSGNTVTCPPFELGRQPSGNQGPSSATVTIEAVAEQCETFQNTATAEATGLAGGAGSGTVTDTEDIIVEGCEVPEPGQQQPNQQPQGGGAAPITQDFEQDSESGEIDQTFDVS